MTTRRRVGLKEVAARAGLSTQTVCAILNGRNAHLFRLATRARCHAAARELGYVANAAARAVSTGRFNRIGLLVGAQPDTGIIPSPLMHGLADGLQRVAERGAPLGLSLDFVDPYADGEEALPLLLREHSVDALLVNYTHFVPPVLAATIAARGIPALWLNTLRDADCVAPDERDGARKAMRHFRARGAAPTAYFSLTPAALCDVSGDAEGRGEHFSLRERWIGYVAEAREHGHAPERLDTDSLPAFLDRVAARRGAGAPAAVFTHKETDAVHVLSRAKERGLRLPRHLLVSTFAGRSFMDDFVDAEITTWGIPNREVGRAAIRLVTRKIAHPEVALPPERVPYGSGPLLTSPVSELFQRTLLPALSAPPGAAAR